MSLTELLSAIRQLPPEDKVRLMHLLVDDVSGGRTEGTDTPPPKLGSHTEQILRAWLECDAAHIDQLRTQQII